MEEIKQIRQYLKDNGIKISHVAEKMGIGKGRMSVLLRQTDMQLSTFKKILKAIGIKEFRVRL